MLAGKVKNNIDVLEGAILIFFIFKKERYQEKFHKQ